MKRIIIVALMLSGCFCSDRGGLGEKCNRDATCDYPNLECRPESKFSSQVECRMKESQTDKEQK